MNPRNAVEAVRRKKGDPYRDIAWANRLSDPISIANIVGEIDGRFGMHGIKPGGENSPSIYFVGNSRAFYMNGLNYYDDQDEESRKYLGFQDDWDGPMQMLWARKGDRVVVATNDQPNVERRLQLMRSSHKQLGLHLEAEIEYTNDLDSWLRKNRGLPQTHIIAPHVISPEILAWTGKNSAEEESRYKLGEGYVRWYTKAGAVQGWTRHGVPIPKTYITRRSDHPDIDQIWISSKFKHAKELVVSGPGGLASEQVRFTTQDKLEETLEGFEPKTLLTVQEKLPLHSSPCVRAVLTDKGVRILGITKQRMKNGGYDGNEYIDGMMKEYEILIPSFSRKVARAFEAMRRDGIRGTTNIDFLVVDKSKRENLPKEASKDRFELLAREANVRPAYSHAIQRIVDEGTIGGKKVTRVHSKMSIPTTNDQFMEEGENGILGVINKLNEDPNMKVVFLNRAPNDTRGSSDAQHYEGLMYCAFVGNENVSAEQLNAFEQEFYSKLSQPMSENQG